MRITNKQDLDRLLGGNQVSHHISQQLERAFTAQQAALKTAPPSPIAQAKKAVLVQSEGEAYVRIALISAFGDWFSGGEVASELAPFSKRKFRADFALPKYRVYVEVDGWQHHGRSLDDHHSDRERALYFSQYDWLPFRVSHSQAKALSAQLIDAIKGAMSLRTPLPRETVHISKNASGRWCQLLNTQD